MKHFKGHTMIYGYARCSTTHNKQDVDRQVRELKAAGAKRIYSEYEHGDSAVKSELELLLNSIQEGDTLIATEVTRLTRSTRQLYDLIETIKLKKIRLVIINSIIVDCRNGVIDPMTNACLQIAGVFAELEKAMTISRIKSGMENAKLKGKKLGRPYLTKDHLPSRLFAYYPLYKAGRLRITDFARLIGVSRTTLYRYIKLAEKE